MVTDLALLHWQQGRFFLQEVAPGFTAAEVMDLPEGTVKSGLHRARKSFRQRWEEG